MGTANGDDDDAPLGAASVNEQAFAAMLGGLVGLAVGGPVGSLVGAASVPYLVKVAQQALAELRGDSERRIISVLGAAVSTAGIDAAELESRIVATPRTRLLAGTAIEAAVRTVNEAKIRGLGRALAAGIIAEDDAAIDNEQLIIGALADMESPHVAVLDLLVNYKPLSGYAEVIAEPYVPPTTDMAGYPREYGFMPGRRRWTEYQVAATRPSTKSVLPGLLGTLQRHGLVAQADTLPEALEKFAREQRQEASRAARTGGSGQVNASTLRRLAPPTTWEPTELGARVLDYLLDAWADVAPATEVGHGEGTEPK